MRLAINGQQLGSTHSLAQVIDVIRSFKVDAMEIWPHNLPGGDTDEEKMRYEKKDVAGAKAILAQNHMALACVTLGFSAMRVCSESGGPANATEALMSAVTAAATLNAPIVNCYLAGIAPSLFVEIVKPAAEYAGANGVTIVLENEAHDESATPEQVRDIVEQVNSPHFGTEYDPCNYYHAYEEPYPRAYEILKDYIAYVHLKGGCYYDERWVSRRGGAMRGKNDKHIGYLPLPQCAFNADTILKRLAEDGYTGYVTLEPHVPAEKVLEFYTIEVPYVRARI